MLPNHIASVEITNLLFHATMVFSPHNFSLRFLFFAFFILSYHITISYTLVNLYIYTLSLCFNNTLFILLLKLTKTHYSLVVWFPPICYEFEIPLPVTSPSCLRRCPSLQNVHFARHLFSLILLLYFTISPPVLSNVIPKTLPHLHAQRVLRHSHVCYPH